MIKLPYIFLFSRDELYYMILLTQCQGKYGLQALDAVFSFTAIGVLTVSINKRIF
jgi:hypothetical protein